DGVVSLLEARESAVGQLKKRFADKENCSINSAVVNIKAGTSSFYTLNLPEFSGLQRPTGLVELFPGVAVQTVESVNTLGIDEYIRGLNIDTDQPNHLYIDIPAQAGSIVRQLVKYEHLHYFSDLLLSGSIEPLYEEDEKLSDIQDFLVSQGYEVVFADESDPDMPLISFKLNPLWQTLCATQIAVTKAAEDHTQLTKEFEQVSNQLEELKKQLDAKTLQVDEQHSQLKALNKQVIDSTETINTLQQKLTSNQTQNDKLNALEEKFIQMMGTQSQQIQQATNALGQHITKSISTGTQQLEAYMGVQSLLELGEVPLKFHGWSINPDLALILADKIKSNNYDLIIEFGSGTSTLLFAKSIMQHRLDGAGTEGQLSIAKQQIDEKLMSYVEPE
ncbi:MAG: hypothetical protein ACKVJE_18820, partial [Pseudomonadales bacterium]